MVTGQPALRVQIIAKGKGGLSGTQRYTAGLLTSLAQVGVQATITYPSAPKIPSPILRILLRLGIDLDAFASSYPWRASLAPADVYHITTQTMATLLRFQRFPRPVVVTVLDIIPHLVRGDTRLDTSRHPVDRYFYDLALSAIQRAQAIIAISEYTRQTIIEQLRISSERITVIYPSLDQQIFRPQPVSPDFYIRYGINGEQPIVLYVGSNDPRKNLSTLVKAFSYLRREFPDALLVLAGKHAFSRETQHLHRLILDEKLGDSVKIYEEMSDQDLVSMYNAATVLVLPSFMEGFGLPVVEAMACATPVICANTSSLPEVAGGAGLLFDPHEPDALGNLLIQVCTNTGLRQKMSEDGVKQAARFAGYSAADQLADVYRSLVLPGWKGMVA
jgi:glycosyltransferase involved in cell wall biosynthesis